MNSLRELCQRGKGKTNKYDIPLSVSENKSCSRPSGTHPPKRRLHYWSDQAAIANAGVIDFLKEAVSRARGDVFASIVCPLITRRAAPTQHIRHTSLFLESYIIPEYVNEQEYDIKKGEKSNQVHHIFTEILDIKFSVVSIFICEEYRSVSEIFEKFRTV